MVPPYSMGRFKTFLDEISLTASQLVNLSHLNFLSCSVTDPIQAIKPRECSKKWNWPRNMVLIKNPQFSLNYYEMLRFHDKYTSDIDTGH